jgi:hypothetical protein
MALISLSIMRINLGKYSNVQRKYKERRDVSRLYRVLVEKLYLIYQKSAVKPVYIFLLPSGAIILLNTSTLTTKI